MRKLGGETADKKKKLVNNLFNFHYLVLYITPTFQKMKQNLYLIVLIKFDSL